MKVYYFQSWLTDHHIRRDVLLHGFPSKKLAEAESKRLRKIGRVCGPISVKYE